MDTDTTMQTAEMRQLRDENANLRDIVATMKTDLTSISYMSKRYRASQKRSMAMMLIIGFATGMAVCFAAIMLL